MSCYLWSQVREQPFISPITISVELTGCTDLRAQRLKLKRERERKEEERVVRRRRNFIFSWVQDQPKLKKKKKTGGTWRWFSPPPFLNPSPYCPEHFIVALSLSSKGTLLLLSHSVMSDSLQPHRLQPVRLLCPCDFPFKNIGSGLPFPSLGDVPNPEIKPVSPALQAGFFTTEPPGKPPKRDSGSKIISYTLPSHTYPNDHSLSNLVSIKASGALQIDSTN